MNESNIVLLKLYGGTTIIGKRVHPDGESFVDKMNYTLDDPRLMAVVPTMRGEVKVMLASVCEPFKSARLSKRLVVNGAQVMFCLDENELDGDLVNGYRSEIAGIKIASPTESMAINNGGDAGGMFEGM